MINIQGTLKIIKEMWQYSNTGKCLDVPRKYLKLILKYGLASASLAVISR
jgi:hypothetical protein